MSTVSTNMSDRSTIVATLAQISTELGIDSVYSHFADGHSLPYLTYIGAGQNQLDAGNGVYWKSNQYQVEFYFAAKDEEVEQSIEDIFVENGWHYSKSDDAFLDDEGIYLIYYDLT